MHVLQVHVLRRLVHVHEADTAAVVGCDHILCAGLAQSPDVIDDVRSQIQHSLHDLWFVGIHRNSHAQPDCFLYYGQYACQFFLQGTAASRGGGLSADIQNIRTVLDQLLGMLQGTLALVLPPSENESGVLLTMPMIRGRLRSSRKWVVCHCGIR